MKELFGRKERKMGKVDTVTYVLFSEWDTLYRIWNGWAKLKVDVKGIT